HKSPPSFLALFHIPSHPPLPILALGFDRDSHPQVFRQPLDRVRRHPAFAAHHPRQLATCHVGALGDRVGRFVARPHRHRYRLRQLTHAKSVPHTLRFSNHHQSTPRPP